MSRKCFQQTPPNTPLMLAFDPDYSVDRTNFIHMYTSKIHQETKHKRNYSICKKIPANTSQYPTVGCIDPYVYIKNTSKDQAWITLFNLQKFSSKHLPIPHCCLHLIQIIWSIKQISSISAVGEQRHKRPNVKNRFNFKKISDDVKCCMYCMYLGQPTK